MKSLDFRCKFEGTMYLVGRDGSISSWNYGFNERAHAEFDCRQWLSMRPDCVFCSVVVGAILVAMAGEFPWRDFRVSLAPLGC